jgi:hypothetical protein
MDEDGFVRQRRNLIVVSFLLLFADALTFRFAEINLVGNKVTLSEPVLVSPILWIAWLYLLLRYWQAFQESGNESLKQFLKGYVRGTATAYAIHRANRELKDTPGLLLSIVPNESKRGSRPVVGIRDLEFQGLTADVVTTYHVTTDKNDQIAKEHAFKLGTWVICSIYVRGLWSATINKSIVSEQYVPFVFAAAPAFYWLYKHGVGIGAG